MKKSKVDYRAKLLGEPEKKENAYKLDEEKHVIVEVTNYKAVIPSAEIKSDLDPSSRDQEIHSDPNPETEESCLNQFSECLSALLQSLIDCISEIRPSCKYGAGSLGLLAIGAALIYLGVYSVDQSLIENSEEITEWDHDIFPLPTGNMTCDEYTGDDCDIQVRDCYPPCNMSLADTACQDLWDRRYKLLCSGDQYTAYMVLGFILGAASCFGGIYLGTLAKIEWNQEQRFQQLLVNSSSDLVEYKEIKDETVGWCNQFSNYLRYLILELKDAISEIKPSSKYRAGGYTLLILGIAGIVVGSVYMNRGRLAGSNAVTKWNYGILPLPTGNMTCDQYTGDDCNIEEKACYPLCNMTLPSDCQDLWNIRYGEFCGDLDLAGIINLVLGIISVLEGGLLLCYSRRSSEEEKRSGMYNNTTALLPRPRRELVSPPSFDSCCRQRGLSL